MKITIELERANLTEDAISAFAVFLDAIPVKNTPALRKRIPKPKEVAEISPVSEAGDAPLTTTVAAAAPPATPVAPPAAPAPTAVPVPAAATQSVVPAAAPAANMDALRTALREYSAINGREAAIDVLKQVGGAASVSATDPAKVSAVITALA